MTTRLRALEGVATEQQLQVIVASGDCRTALQLRGTESMTMTRQSDWAGLRVSVISRRGTVYKVGGKYRFHVRVEGDNSSIRPLEYGGVTINVPTINSRDKYQATEIQLSSVGGSAPSRYGPRDEIMVFRDDGSFGTKAATCLLLESVREQWPPHERIALEADLIAPCSRLDLHVRVWSSHPETRDGFGEPDWRAATHKDQQGISAYPLTLRFGRIHELIWSLFGAKCNACQTRTRHAMLPPAQSRLDPHAIVCKACSDCLNSEADARAEATKEKAKKSATRRHRHPGQMEATA